MTKPVVAVEDRQWIARALRDGVPLAEICRELSLDAAAVVAAHRIHQRGFGKSSPVAAAPADNGAGVYRRKTCARCSARFTTTPQRRVLCARCFRVADDGVGDPGDGGNTGDLETLDR